MYAEKIEEDRDDIDERTDDNVTGDAGGDDDDFC